MAVNESKPTPTAQEQRENSKPPGRPWPKGVSGNPGGRRKGAVSLKATLTRALTKADADAIARKLIDGAKAGNTPSLGNQGLERVPCCTSSALLIVLRRVPYTAVTLK